MTSRGTAPSVIVEIVYSQERSPNIPGESFPAETGFVFWRREWDLNPRGPQGPQADRSLFFPGLGPHFSAWTALYQAQESRPNPGLGPHFSAWTALYQAQESRPNLARHWDYFPSGTRAAQGIDFFSRGSFYTGATLAFFFIIGPEWTYPAFLEFPAYRFQNFHHAGLMAAPIIPRIPAVKTSIAGKAKLVITSSMMPPIAAMIPPNRMGPV